MPNFYDFRVIRDLDTINLRFISVNHFQSYKNIKNHFLKLREVVKSPSKLIENFILDCENIFNLTPPEVYKINRINSRRGI